VTASDNIGIVEAFIEYRYGDGPETKVKMSGLGYYTAVRTYTYDVMVPVNILEPIHYTIVLNDMAGNKVERTGTVTIMDSIAPFADAGFDVVVKRGTIVVLNSSASSDNIGITNWTWMVDYGTGTDSIEGMVIEQKFNKAGTFTITLTVKDGYGNIGTDTVTINVERTEEKNRSYLVYSVFVMIIVLVVLISVYFLIIRRKSVEYQGKL